MDRNAMFTSLGAGFDVLVIGGGATGLGIAVDAVTRGYRTALVEAGDFAQATSSRATKLIHGGVRYLASGQIHLVYEALHERAFMARNAPHLIRPLPFILPTYRYPQLPYYGAGLLLYNLLSGRSTMGPTRILGPGATVERIPGIARPHLAGGILYHDAQFNDARFALALARTAVDHGAVVLNYARLERLFYTGEKVSGAIVRDLETGAESEVHAKAVINATGIFVDEIRKLDDPARPKLLSVSRGTHIVVAPETLGGNHAILVPRTEDGRVIFAIPWEGRVVIGTTDLPVSEPQTEPGHTPAEIEYLLDHINPYLQRALKTEDIVSVFSGLRPLISSSGGAKTSRLSREHHIDLSGHGLITIAGGKWTTYRRMAQDALNFAIRHEMLPAARCITQSVAIHGAANSEKSAAGDRYLAEYGTDAAEIERLIAAEPCLGDRIDADLPYSFAQAVYAVRFEMARMLEDVLSRRTRALLLDSRAALRAAPRVAQTIARELSRPASWAEDQVQQFAELVRSNYSLG